MRAAAVAPRTRCATLRQNRRLRRPPKSRNRLLRPYLCLGDRTTVTASFFRLRNRKLPVALLQRLQRISVITVDTFVFRPHSVLMTVFDLVALFGRTHFDFSFFFSFCRHISVRSGDGGRQESRRFLHTAAPSPVGGRDHSGHGGRRLVAVFLHRCLRKGPRSQESRLHPGRRHRLS